MTDFEIKVRCADAMGGHYIQCGVVHLAGDFDSNNNRPIYDPLINDAQAMALVKKCRLQVRPAPISDGWLSTDEKGVITYAHQNLNRSICECVAKALSKAK